METFYKVGIWQKDEESERRKTGKTIFFTIFGPFFPIYLAINAFTCVDRNESIFSVHLSIQTAVVYLKCLYLVFKKKEILEFLNDKFVVHSIENREEYEQANREIQKFMKGVQAFKILVFATTAMLIVVRLPIFTGGKELPVFISFSWNDSEIIYWSTYLAISLSMVLYATANLAIAMIWYIMLNYSIEYKMLGNKFRNLKVGAGVRKMKTRAVKNRKNVRLAPRNMFVENLIVLIKAHQNLTETVERFKSFFSTIFLAQIATSGIGICVSVYCLAFVSKANIFQTQMFVVILLYGLSDIFLVMYLANEITASSDRLSYCLFESNWVEQTESCKKYVLILGEVFKQPQQLCILIYPLNLQTFTSIINGAYSMFNILRNFQ